MGFLWARGSSNQETRPGARRQLSRLSLTSATLISWQRSAATWANRWSEGKYQRCPKLRRSPAGAGKHPLGVGSQVTVRMKIGVLALQGDFAEHIAMLKRIGVMTAEIRLPDQLGD